MFLIQQPEFTIREFKESDFNKLYLIADAINKQANEKEGFQPFYAFQLDVKQSDYQDALQKKIRMFLQKAHIEKNEKERKTHRLALCDSRGVLIGNITINSVPIIDERGNKIYGDLGYFINPTDGRKGLMSKALSCVLDVYFKMHEELDVTLHPNNLYSIKLMQRFNAKVVGFKSSSVYQNEPRMVLKIYKQDFLSARNPRVITKQGITPCSFDKGLIRDV